MTDLTTLPDRALSIRQPWAWAILNAGKDVENRSRRFHYRGPICIHAAKGCTAQEYNEFIRAIHHVSLSRPFPPGRRVPPRADLERGGIVGTAEIVDCVEASDSPWFFGPFGLVLANVQPVPFIPVKGALGLFKWKEKKEAQHG